MASLFFSMSFLPVWAEDKELEFSHVVVHFQKKEYHLLHQKLKPLLKADPDNLNYLELSAVTRQAQNQPARARKQFESLVKKRGVLNIPESKIHEYSFEIAYAYFREKDYSQAKKTFETLIRSKFNLAKCYYYLGIIAFNEQRYNESKGHFKKAADLDTTQISLSSGIFLSKIAKIQNDPKASIRQKPRLRQLAKQSIKTETDSKNLNLFQEIVSRTDPQADQQFPIGVTLLGSVDTNVFQEPSGRASYVQVLLYGLSFVTSSFEMNHFEATYGGKLNINSNASTNEAQFISQQLAFTYTRYPLAETSYGLKAQTTGSFNFRSDVYRPHSLTAAFGPFVRRELESEWLLQGELLFEPQKFFVDTLTDDANHRSGWILATSINFSRLERDKFWNPIVGVEAKLSGNLGDQRQFRELNHFIENIVYFSERVSATQSLTHRLIYYPNSSKRLDQGFSLSSALSYQFLPQLNSLFGIRYEKIFSNSDNHPYSQFVFSIGIRWLT